jgi:hypothetical protein
MSDEIQEYIHRLEKQNEKLEASLENYIKIAGGRYQIYVVDPTMDKIDFLKIIDYYTSFGWELQPKRKVEDSKRRWECFCLPERLQEKIAGYNQKVDRFSVYKQPFRFPYKPREKTLFKKYGAEYIEAINKFNIMLNTQATLEARLPLEIYDQWVNEYSFP